MWGKSLQEMLPHLAAGASVMCFGGLSCHCGLDFPAAAKDWAALFVDEHLEVLSPQHVGKGFRTS